MLGHAKDNLYMLDILQFMSMITHYKKKNYYVDVFISICWGSYPLQLNLWGFLNLHSYILHNLFVEV